MDGFLTRLVVGASIGLAAFVGARQVMAVPIFTLAAVQSPTTRTVHGELLKVETSERTMIVRTALSDREFHYNEQTKIIGAERGAQGLATLAGAQVHVEYRTEAQIDLAVTVEIRTPQLPPTMPVP